MNARGARPGRPLPSAAPSKQRTIAEGADRDRSAPSKRLTIAGRADQGRSAPSKRRRGEGGQMTVLIIGFTAIILLMIVVVTDISKVFLVRRDLDATADGAVLAAANGLAAIYAQPAADGNAELDPDEARRLTADYLDQIAASNRFDTLDWSTDVNGTTVTVHLTSTVNLPFQPPGWPTTTQITAASTATVPIR